MTLTLSKGFWAGTVGESIDDMIFISKLTVAAGSSSAEFTTGIDSTYRIYKIFGSAYRDATTTTGLAYQVSIDGGTSYGVTTTTTLFESYNYYDSSGNTLRNQPAESYVATTNFMRFAPTGWGGFEMTLLDPANPSVDRKSIFVVAYGDADHDDYVNQKQSAATVATSSAINAIKFQPSSGNFEAVICLYGLKDS